MVYILTWTSLVLISLSLVYLSKWVKEGALVWALVGLAFVEITLIMVLRILK